MLLLPQDAELFFKLHRSLMCYVNEQLQIVSGVETPLEFGSLPLELRVEVRSAFLERIDLIDEFLAANPYDLSREELDLVAAWKDFVFGTFFVFRYLKKYTVFLTSGTEESTAIAYGVLALTEPLEEVLGTRLPRILETMLLPFQGQIVYDGLLCGMDVSFGGGIKRTLNEEYKQAKAERGIVTSLPVDVRPGAASEPARKQTAKKKAKPKRKKAKTKRGPSSDDKRVAKLISALVADFCRERLNKEYAEVCRELTEKLARKRPSPLVRGNPETWAAGIVRTIGWVNFLDDKSQKPHMKLPRIDEAFGIGQSTGQQKSKEIRKMLRIRQFDLNWTLPSRMDDNPMLWMLEVNGFIMDIRNCPRGAQEAAFERGLIPYIPADRE